ncbi:MAG TPA: lamin tail domain-containing protein [Verrucomicrobiae bacterium]
MRSFAARAALQLVVVFGLVSSSFGQIYSGSNIGGDTAGATTQVSGGYNLRSAGREIGGAADQFQFGQAQRTGDFDVRVRVQSLTITDSYVQAGLMAREGLDVGSRFAGVFSSSAQLGAFFESRATAGAASSTVAPATQFPPNYPQMWLRLRRAGNVFTGYGSFDGQNWQVLGTTTLALPSSLFFGMALASVNTNEVATAEFRDIGNVSAPGTFTYLPDREPLGPSNRRTGLTFSEIMYNPAPRTDTNSLEFVEIYNGETIFVDLTGWKIAGGIEYQFPDGFRLEAGEFVVVAADPALVQITYGITGVLGPFTGRLNNGGDAVLLLNEAGAVRLEVEYDSNPPWPVLPDGSGHSLILAKPSYGEDDHRAWAASEMIGGSPGQVDAIQPTAAKAVVINEFLAHTDDPVEDFIELYNASNGNVDISNCILTDDITTNRFRIPSPTILGPGQFIRFQQSQLGFALSSAGETIYFASANKDRVFDAVKFEGQENGVSTGRAPDGSPTLRRLSAPTPGLPNAERRIENVVISELMYHSITGDDNDQYVEIHNRSGSAVDLSGWIISDGIDFEFPAGATVPANGYVVVARDVVRTLANYPQLNTNNTFGNFDGSLSRSSERVALAMRDFVTETNSLNVQVTSTIYIDVSEVIYHDGGRWSELADGGGSSLELVDARADTMFAGSWAPSNESQKAGWTTVEYTGRLDHGNGTYNFFQISMQGAGECLVDDIEFIPSGSTNILVNGNFDQPNSTWTFWGNHRGSFITNGGAFSGPNAMFVRAPGDGDTAHNVIRGTTVRAVTSGIATIRAKVRWVSGWPEVLMRVRGNWIELPARMNVPKNLGTPGLANSRRVQNAGPAIYDVTHRPALPAANEAVVVTARVSDPDGLGAPLMQFRVDPSATLTTVTMRDDGLGGDVLAGDGLFAGVIPGQASGARVAFRVTASDDSTGSVSSTFPVNAPVTECLVRWGDTIPFGSFAHYHMWNTAAMDSARAASPDLDNTWYDGTLVYGNQRVIYNIGFRDKGSPYHSGRGDFAVTVPKDDLLLGIDDRVFASTGNGGSEGTGMKTDVANWIAEEMGIPFLHSHYMRLYHNGTRFRDVVYDMEQPNRYYAQSWFGGGGVKDDLFKIAIWFEFDSANSGFNSTPATLSRYLSDGQHKLARYRWNWQIRPGTDTANDYSTIFNLVNAANNSTERLRTLPLLADVENWMRVFAFNRFVGNWDSFSYRVGQNMYMYAPLGQRATLLPWDIDFVLGEGDQPGAPPYFGSQDGVVQTLMNLPVYRRMLYRAYQDAVKGPALPQNFQPQVDARRQAQLKNGVTLTAPGSITTFLNSSRANLSNQVARADAPALAITSNSGLDFISAEPTVTLTGYAPIAVASIEVNGVPFPVTWINLTNWSMVVPLGGRTNILQFAGYDLRGELVPNATDSITIEYTGAVPQPNDWVVINEIMYNPAFADAEFIELHNRHPSYAFDLSGFQLSGVDFTFPAGSLIQPNGYLVIVENRAVFANVYDPLLPVLGPYNGNLQRDGETLRLIKPGATASENVVIDEVRYENLPPWPVLADGFGPSLQLIDPAQDNRRAGNWAATTVADPERATPGRQNVVRTLLQPFPEIWLNEIAPVNVSGPTDSFGEREPWLEIYNKGTTEVDLSGMALTDDPAAPGKWQFPSGARILAGQFVVVWLDGEPNETTATEWHTGFRVTGTNGVIALTRPQGTTSGTVDHLRYLVTSPQNSYGLYPDGDPRRRRMLYVPTPGGPNDQSIPNVRVTINEWVAASQSVIRDPADNQFEDWFELYNDGTNTVDLSGFYLSDSISEPLFRIPAGYTIGPKQFRIIWADNEATQNAPGRDLHVGFALSAGGEEIAIFTPDEQLLDSVVFGQQAQNISEGRYPDGGPEPFALFLTPTPGTANAANFANRAPVIMQIGDTSIDEGANFNVTVNATDPDAGQQITFVLVNPPSGASINPTSGQITWPTSETHGPGVYTLSVRATDNGTPQRSATMTFRVNVREVNQAPQIPVLGNVSVNEGSELIVNAAATDADFPAQAIVYTLESGAPVGVQIDNRGEVTWTPTEAQGPGVYTIIVRATDGGTPALSATRSFQVTVVDINNPPIITEIFPRNVNEGTMLTVQVAAEDPETPPAALTYSIDSGPAGLTINAATGLISWTPNESQGPRDYNVVVRVSEPGGTPSSTASFLIGVNEVNTAPVLSPIGNMVVRPRDTITFTNLATDADLPEQGLSFVAFGLPSGATLDPVTGVLTWQVGNDPVIGTNRVTIRVMDNGSPAFNDEESFDLVVQAPPPIVINEIMHRPTQQSAEYVELANISAVNTVDISGWRLTGYDYTFPANTILPPNSFVCVARFLTGFRGAYGGGPRALGDAVLNLPATGGLIQLIRPANGTRPELIVDEVEFSTNAPWPVEATQGASLQLIDPWEDNRRVSNWSASLAATTNATTTIVPITGTWRYLESSQAPGANWNTLAYPDSGWTPGNALLYVEDAALPVAKNTPLTIGSTAYYFRTRFNFSGNPAGATLNITPVIDDGAVFYLNGQEVYRLRMPAGTIAHTTPASATVGNATLEGPFTVPATGLVVGENVLAVEVHQSGAGSTDVVFGSEFQLTSAVSVRATPGAPNSVLRDVPTIPPVWINEVHPINTTGITDMNGERDPWLELHNAGLTPVDLTDWTLSDDSAALTKFSFPAGTTIPAGGYLLVWADGSAVSPLQEVHANFRLSSTFGAVYLSMRQFGVPVLADYAQYTAVPNQSFGSPGDDGPIGRRTLTQSTPGTANGGTPEVGVTLTFQRNAGFPAVGWQSIQGRQYTVEATSDLGAGQWQTLQQFTGNGSLLLYTDSSSPRPNTKFYRVRSN